MHQSYLLIRRKFPRGLNVKLVSERNKWSRLHRLSCQGKNQSSSTWGVHQQSPMRKNKAFNSCDLQTKVCMSRGHNVQPDCGDPNQDDRARNTQHYKGRYHELILIICLHRSINPAYIMDMYSYSTYPDYVVGVYRLNQRQWHSENSEFTRLSSPWFFGHSVRHGSQDPLHHGQMLPVVMGLKKWTQ